MVVKSKVYDLKYLKKTLRVGVLGILGPDGCLVSRSNRQKLWFKGYDDKRTKKKWGELKESLKEEIQRMKKTKNPHLFILLMHGGGDEDEEIAKMDIGIDIIIAGHTHSLYHKKIKNTYISQAGHYGQQLGVMPLVYSGNKLRYHGKIKPYFVNVNNSIKADEKYLRKINFYKSIVDKQLKNKGFQFDTPIMHSEKDLKRVSKDIKNPMGHFVTDAILNNLNRNHDIDFYFTSLALIRADIMGDTPYQFSDLFKVLPIGFEPKDGKYELGTPIVSFYLSKKEVVQLIGFMELYSHISRRFTPAFSSNLSFDVSKWGVPFVNRIKNITLNGKKYEDWPDYIHVATNSFVASYVDFVKNKTFGQIKFDPKDFRGKIIEKPYENYPPEYLAFIKELKLKN